MAEILHLPARPHGCAGAGRRHADLAAAYERGTDLGSRAPHIQAIGGSLLELIRALERAIEDLELSLVKLSLQDLDAREVLRGFISEAKSLANMAQSFPNTAPGQTSLAQQFPAAF